MNEDLFQEGPPAEGEPQAEPKAAKKSKPPKAAESAQPDPASVGPALAEAMGGPAATDASIEAERDRQAAQPEPSAEARTELIVAEAQADAVALFTDEKRYSEFYEKVKGAVSGFEPDLSTPKGRAAIASLAFRVTKSKTALDKAGLGLTEGWRKSIAEVNASRRKMVDELDELAKEVRRPLTEWEEAEDQRQARVAECIKWLKEQATVQEGEDAAAVEVRGRELLAYPIDPEAFLERTEEAQEARDSSAKLLAQAMHRMRQEETDRAELERLRAEKEEREAREAEERERREKEEADRLAREQQERFEREEAERRAQEIREAEERAALAAREAEAARLRAEEEDRERARQAEAEERERAHQAALEEERRAREAAEAQARREREEHEAKERERLAREEEERQERERLAEEERARQADQEHREAIQAEAASAIEKAIGKNMPKEALAAAAERIVLAIAAGNVPHTSIKF